MTYKKLVVYALIAIAMGALVWSFNTYQKTHTTVVYHSQKDDPIMTSYDHPVAPTDNPESKKYIFYGGADIENKIFNNLKIFGSATIKHSIIKKNASIFGALNTNDSTYNHLSINGAIKAVTTSIKHAFINGAVHFIHVTSDDMISISGAFQAQFSKLNNMEVTATSLKVKDCQINNLYIHAPERMKNTPQILHVSGQSTLKSVSFENGSGEVHIKGDDVKIHTLQGGKIIRAH